MIKVVTPPTPPKLILNKPAIISRRPSSCSKCGK
jgi:hypothetical protein